MLGSTQFSRRFDTKYAIVSDIPQEKIPSSLLGYLLGFFFDYQQDPNLSDGWESETVPNVIFVGYYLFPLLEICRVPKLGFDV